MNLKSLIITLLFIPVALFSSIAADLTTEDGGTMEDLGGGEYLSGSGEITQVESAGDGEYITTGNDVVEDMGDGEYSSSAGGEMRDMGDSGLVDDGD